MAKAKRTAKVAKSYAVETASELVRLMKKAGAGEVKMGIAREFLRKEMLREKAVDPDVEDLLEALRADVRVTPGNMARYERLAILGEDFWDEKGNEVKDATERPAAEIEDLIGKDVAEASAMVKGEHPGEDPDIEPGGLDRTDSPALHAADARAEETRNEIGDAVSQKEAEERAEEARKAQAKPHTQQTAATLPPGAQPPKPIDPKNPPKK